jgi:hypothetical protein
MPRQEQITENHVFKALHAAGFSPTGLLLFADKPGVKLRDGLVEVITVHLPTGPC